MNAYELADEAYKKATTRFDYDVALTMKQLIQENSQQADRIAELEETINACYTVQKMQAEEVYKGNDRIAELEKQVNLHKNAHHKCVEILQEKQSEPVGLFKEESWGWIQALPTEDNHNLIPLYTTPQTKPLSDEEIIKIFNQIWNDGGNTNGVMHRFARAIEERVRGIK